MEESDEIEQKLKEIIERETGKLSFKNEKDRIAYQEELLQRVLQEDRKVLLEQGLEKWVGEKVVQRDGQTRKNLEGRTEQEKTEKPKVENPEKAEEEIKEKEIEDEDPPEKTKEMEKEEQKEKVSVKDNKAETREEQIPEDVVKACQKLGIVQIKSYMYAKGNEFADKTEVPYVNRNAENVLLIRAADYGKNTDKYFVFQGDRLCVPGNKDEEIDQVAGNRSQNSRNGTLMKPLEIEDEEQYVEYEDSQGLVIQEKLEESMQLSTEDLKEYKKKIQEALEHYSNELEKIEETPFLNDLQKDELYAQANERFNENNEKIAKECHVNLSDVKAINLVTDERTKAQIEENDEPEAWEVPGKRVRGE